MKKRLYILYILNKRTLTTENRSTVVDNVFLLDVSMFNDLVIKNNPAKKAKPFFVFMKGVSTASRSSHDTRRQNFLLQSSQ